MAVREFVYTVGKNDIAAANIPQAGVQGEHNATKVTFEVDKELEKELLALSTEENKVLLYRFDRYDGTGGKNSTEENEMYLDKTTKFSHLIEKWQTKYGGTIQLYFVITIDERKKDEKTGTDENKTALELYSFCVKMQLKSLPEAAETDDENYDAVATLAYRAKEAAKRSEDAASDAENAAQRTELAHAALVGGSDWIFNGGNASSAIRIDLVVDSEVINDSDNPVKSKAIKTYIDEKTNALATENEEQNKAIAENSKVVGAMADYIVERGTVGIWTYEKWASGEVKCYGVTKPADIALTVKWGGGVRYANLEESLPEGLFIGDPYYANVDTRSGGGILTCSVKPFKSGSVCWYVAEHGGTTATLNMIFMIALIGRWKEEE